MKLLGKYKRDVATCYQKLLEENQVLVEVENMTNPYFRMFRWSDYNLLVKEEDLELAKNLIKTFEEKAQITVEEIDKKIRPILMTTTIVLFLSIIFYFVVKK
jgi:hypothetical protein